MHIGTCNLISNLATGGMNAKLTGTFTDLMQSSKCLTYKPVGSPTDELVVADSGCPDSIGICKRRIGKKFLMTIFYFYR